MKAHKEWLAEHYKNHRGMDRYDPTNEQGWKAALEWAYEEIAKHEEGGIIPSDQVRVTFTNELYGGD